MRKFLLLKMVREVIMMRNNVVGFQRFFKILFLCALAGLWLSLPGCSSKGENLDKLTEKAPDWVIKGSGAFDPAKDKSLYGVGYASKNPSIAMGRTISENRARQELAAVINTYVGRLIKDFMETHQDYMDPAKSNTVEFVSVIAKNVTDATLVGSKVIDRWTDPEGGLYSLAQLSEDSVINAIQQQTAEAARKQAIFLKNKTDEALSELNKELDAKKAPSAS
jgi:hypothetical protein